MLLYATMCILSRLAKVASSVIVNIVISWEASLEAEEAGYPVAHRVPPTIDLILGIFAGKALWITTEVSTKRVGVDQGLFKRSAGRLDDLDWPHLPASHPGLLLLLLHPLL